MATGRVTVEEAVEAEEVAVGVDQESRKQSGEQEAVQSRMIQNCKVMLKVFAVKDGLWSWGIQKEPSFMQEHHFVLVGFSVVEQ
jgi:hypothetical protein